MSSENAAPRPPATAPAGDMADHEGLFLAFDQHIRKIVEHTEALRLLADQTRERMARLVAKAGERPSC
jgi:hypothetical protein